MPIPKKKIKTKKGSQTKRIAKTPVTEKQVKPTEGLMN